MKDVRTKSRKIDPLIVRKMYELTLPPLVCADVPYILKNPKFLHQKVWTSASKTSFPFPHWTTLLTADVFLDSP